MFNKGDEIMNKRLSRKIFLFVSMIILFITLSFVSACAKKYHVTFMVDSTEYEVVDVKKGQTISEIDAPNKDGQYFVCWLDGSVAFDFSIAIEKNYTLVAKYQTECEKNGHAWIDATCTMPKTCEICGVTEGESLGHNWVEATHDAPKTCTRCGATEGEVLPLATSIELNYSNTELLYIGDTFDLDPIIYPVGAIQDVTYSLKSDKPNLATISEDGLFTALSDGRVYITIVSVDNPTVSFTMTVDILHPLLENEGFEVFNVMTGFGSDASSEIEINYHTYNTMTEVEYTLASDPDFTNVTTITGEGSYYAEENTTILEAAFVPRNVYRVSIKGLNPDTEYIYRINQGNDTYTDVYRFKTAKGANTDSAFIILADVHYYYVTKEDGTFESTGAELSETVIQKILEKNPNVGFVATAGDTIDRGGSAKTWEIFFDKSESLTYLPRTSVAGNHEYYIEGMGSADGTYQKLHSANVFNGPSSQLGLSCYFVYNDVLFITLDNEKTDGRNEMLVWLEDVLANVDYRYSVIMMHTPVYYENTETSQRDRDEVLMSIFEKYCVDLVVAGHYHGDRYRPNYYEGEDSLDPYLGVNYMTLSFAGVKSQSASNPASGYLVETHDGTITVKRIDENGNIVSTRTMTSKKEQPVVSDTKENLINSLNYTLDEENGTYTLHFANTFYGNVKEVKVEETIHGNIHTNVVFPTPSYNKLVVDGLQKFYDYHFNITIVFEDGTTYETETSVELGPDIHLTAQDITTNSAILTFTEADASLLWTIKDYVVYINGQEADIFEYLDNYEAVTSYALTGLEDGTEYTIKLVARDYYGNPMFESEVTFTTLA